MKKTIFLSGRLLEYELQRKKVKNINLRIRPQEVFVSASKFVPQSAIDTFLKDRAEFIFSALDRFAAAEKPCFGDGAIVPILGKDYILRIIADEKNGFELKEDSIIFRLKDCSDAVLIRKTLDSLYRKTAVETVPAICSRLCKKMGREMPEIKYRAMKSRWGSCTPAKKQICINTRLMTAPEFCVEFVIAHELCHFLRADHSAHFYIELEKIMPDWKEKKTALKSYGKFLQ